MLHRIGFALLLIIIFLLSPPGDALAEKRVALIIGNSAYKNVTKLPNPVKDSTAVAEMFKKTNFDVVESLVRERERNSYLRRSGRSSRSMVAALIFSNFALVWRAQLSSLCRSRTVTISASAGCKRLPQM